MMDWFNTNLYRGLGYGLVYPQILEYCALQDEAAYCSVSPETFDDYRRRAIVPDPIISTNRWDRKLIDIWLDKASGIASATATSLDTWRANRDG